MKDLMKRFTTFFDEFEKDFDKKLENSIYSNVSIQTTNGIRIENRNGNLIIDGKITSLKVNGKIIELK